MQIKSINVADIKPNPDQARKYFDETALEELKESIIAQKTLLQNIIVCEDENVQGKYIIVAGERRFKAVQLIINDENYKELHQQFQALTVGIVDAQNSQEISLIENIQREDLTLVEYAEGLKKLKDDKNINQAKLAEFVNKSPNRISEILAINKLHQRIRDEARPMKDVPQYIFDEVLKCKEEKEQLQKWDDLKDKKVTRSQLRTAKAELGNTTKPFDLNTTLKPIKNFTKQLKKLNQLTNKHIDTAGKDSIQAELEAMWTEIETFAKNFGITIVNENNTATENTSSDIPQEAVNK